MKRKAKLKKIKIIENKLAKLLKKDTGMYLAIGFENCDRMLVPSKSVKVAYCDEIRDMTIMKNGVIHSSKICKVALAIIDKEFLKKEYYDFVESSSSLLDSDRTNEGRLKLCDIVDFEFIENLCENNKKRESNCISVEWGGNDDYTNENVHFGKTKNGDMWIGVYEKEDKHLKDIKRNWLCK